MADLGEPSGLQRFAQGFGAGFTGTPLSRIQKNARETQLLQRIQDQRNNPQVMQGDAAKGLAISNPEQFQKVAKALNTTDQLGVQASYDAALKINNLMTQGRFQDVLGVFQKRIEAGQAPGVERDMSDTIDAADRYQKALTSGDDDEIGKIAGEFAGMVAEGRELGILPKKAAGFTLGQGQKRFAAGGEEIAAVAPKAGTVGGKAAGTKEFEALTEGLSEEQKAEATLIKLGLSPRAVGNAIQTITKEGIEKEIGNASAIIKEREKFGAMTGASRAKAIDKGFEKIVNIDKSVRNMDRALGALKEGAGVGAIENVFKSFKAASVLLDNIQGSMALDVVGATTFGALSKGELDLARAVALPTGLDTPELIQWLKDKRAAQQKLRDYYNEQIQFLDQGGTVAGFLRQKERGLEEGAAPSEELKTGQAQRLVFDPQSGQLVPK